MRLVVQYLTKAAIKPLSTIYNMHGSVRCNLFVTVLCAPARMVLQLSVQELTTAQLLRWVIWCANRAVQACIGDIYAMQRNPTSCTLSATYSIQLHRSDDSIFVLFASAA